MKYNWKRTVDFISQHETQEEWVSNFGKTNVLVKYGKKLDIHSLRSKEVYATEAINLNKTREFFTTLNLFDSITECPACESSARDAQPYVKVWSATYLRCSSCGHAFCDITPSAEALSQYYSQNIIGNTYYTNKAQIENRIEQIYTPKLLWIIEAYKKSFGRLPKSILDLGAGSGHFLECAKRNGVDVAGLEIDDTYRKWAKENFGLELYKDRASLVKSGNKKFDIVTSFNVIEHIPQPKTFIDLYDEFSHSESLIVVETPKFNSVTSALQRVYPETVRGHLMPFIHVHMFSDNSLATLLKRKGFTPRHAWYFGQDVSEIFYHLSVSLQADVIPLLKDLFNPLQEVFDAGHSSDLMLFAAVKD